MNLGKIHEFTNHGTLYLDQPPLKDIKINEADH
jgi:hypothetical protein